MSWDFSKNKERRGYHHGNLREALMKAALALIGEKGPAGFSFAEVARAAGVSPAAPYRHYRDRDALMADVAGHGFEEFTAALEAAWNGGKGDPVAALQRTGAAYLDFARQKPSLYAAMFESGLCPADHPALAVAGDTAMGVLRKACESVIATLPADRKAPPLMMALHLWSLCHGMASLFARGDTARRPVPMPPEELLEAAVLIYLDGLRGGRR